MAEIPGFDKSSYMSTKNSIDWLNKSSNENNFNIDIRREIEKEKKSIIDMSNLERLEITYSINTNNYLANKTKYTGQSILIKEVLWSDSEHNDTYIQWFNKKKWNYLSKITDFESKLLNPNFSLVWPKENDSTLNSREFANYLIYLKSKWLFDIDTLIKKVWNKNMKELIELWTSKENTTTKDILRKNWFENIIEEILNPEALLHENNKGKYENRINCIPNKNLENICSKIRNWKVNELTLKNFKKQLPENECWSDWVTKIVIAINNFEINKSKASLIEQLREKLKWHKDLAKKLFEKLERSATNEPCTFELYKIIDDFNKNEIAQRNKEIQEKNKKLPEWENKIPQITTLSAEDSVQIVPQLLKHTDLIVATSIKQIDEKSSKDWLSDKEKKELESKRNSLVRKRKKINRALTIANNTTVKDHAKIIRLKEGNKTNKEILEKLRESNKNLDNAIKKFEEEEKKKNEEKKGKNPKEENQSETKNQSLEQKTEYLKSWDWYSFIYKWKTIKITKEEKSLIENNEQAKENLVKTRDILEKTNLWKIQKFIPQIFWVISSIWLQINDWDYLNENEIKLFLSKIIKSIEKELKEKWVNDLPTESQELNEYIESIKRINKIWAIWTIKEVNMYWESFIEEIFINKFCNRYSSISNFDPIKFQKSL